MRDRRCESGPLEPAGAVSGPSSLSRRSLAVVLLYGAVLLLVDLGPGWALTFHEVNFAEPGREFLRDGDWLVPRIVGEPMWDKPPLTQWAIAASIGLLGTEAEWAVRLPTVLATIGTALLVAALAARWHGDRVGRLAGLIQLTTVYVFFQARLAEADMILCAAVALAFLALGFGVVDRSPEDRCPPRGLVLAFFLAAGLSFLAKGLIGPAFVAGGSGLFALIDRRRATWRFLLDPVGWGLMAACVVGWPLLAAGNDPEFLEVWWTNNVDRLAGRLEGGDKDPFFYLYMVPALMLPWTPFVVSGLWAGWKKQEAPGRPWRLLLCWFAAGLAIITLSAWKHKHYAIPILPPLSIIAAFGLARHVFNDRPPRTLALRIVGVLLVLAGLVGIGMGLDRSSIPLAASGGSGVIAGLGLIASGWLRGLGKPEAGLAAVFGAILGGFVLIQSLVLPSFDLYRDQSDLARRTNALLPPDAELVVVEIPDPQIIYYLRLPVRYYRDRDEFAAEAARRGGTFHVVGPSKILPALQRLGSVRVLDRCETVHPRKQEHDRMLTIEVRPAPTRMSRL
ncbi:N/A [soil metagenome]